MLTLITLFAKILDLWLGSKIKDKAELARQRVELSNSVKSLTAIILDATTWGERCMDAKAKLDAKFNAREQRDREIAEIKKTLEPIIEPAKPL